MRNLTRLEELSFAVLAFFLFLALPTPWWWFFVLLLVPDLSMVGYLLNPAIGAILYDVVHHRGVSVMLYIAGSLSGIPWLQAAALILFAHSTLDRVLGYGLKYLDSFQHTHLGMIGRTSDTGMR